MNRTLGSLTLLAMNTLHRALDHPLARGLDIDSARATEVHAELIRREPFRRLLYEYYYEAFVKARRLSPPGAAVEIGAGAGFLADLIPDLVTVDLRPGARVTVVGDAQCLPLADGSVGCLFLLNVAHHLANLPRFFREAERVLAPEGRMVLIEPWVSPLSRFVYGRLHPEPFDPGQTSWELPAAGTMSGANSALSWNVIVRDRERFEQSFPGLEIARITPHTVLLYILSGGVSMRSLAPARWFAALRSAEERLGPLLPHLASLMTVEIVRRP